MSLVSIKSSRIDWQYAHGDLEQILHALKANEWIASDRSSAYDPALEPIISSKLELLESGVLDEENMLKEAYGTIDKEDDLLSGSAFNESPRMSSGESPPRLSCSDTTNDGIEIFDADLQGTIWTLTTSLGSLEDRLATKFSEINERLTSLETARESHNHGQSKQDKTLSHMSQKLQRIEENQSGSLNSEFSEQIQKLEDQHNRHVKALEEVVSHIDQLTSDGKDQEIRLEKLNTQVTKLPDFLSSNLNQNSDTIQQIEKDNQILKDKQSLLQGKIKKLQSQFQATGVATLEQARAESSEMTVSLDRRLEKLESQMVNRAELHKVKRFLHSLQQEFMEKVKKIEDVFSENNKANYFSSIMKRLTSVETQISNVAVVNQNSVQAPVDRLETRINQLEQENQNRLNQLEQDNQNRIHQLEKENYGIGEIRDKLLSTVEKLEKIEDPPFCVSPNPPDLDVPIGIKSTRTPTKHFIADSGPHRYSPQASSPLSAELESELEDLLPGKSATGPISVLHSRQTTTFKSFSPLKSLRVSQFSTPAATDRSCYTSWPSSELQATLSKRGFVIEDNRPMIRRT